MKGIKPKRKIHPSPSSSTATDASAAALRLLPAAVLALTAALSSEDKQVLAYLVTRSMSACVGSPTRRRHISKGKGSAMSHHRSSFGCGCFECYTGFWYRWDCSPNRDLIHLAIDAFEDHLSLSERAAAAARGSRRRARRSAEKKRADMETTPERKQEAEVFGVSAVQFSSQLVDEDVESTVKDAVPGPASEEPQFEEAEEEVADGGRRGGYWADVMGIINWRLWELWRPDVESS